MSAWHALSDFFGITNEAGPGYGFWSGFGSDLGELAIIGGLTAAYRKHNCHAKGCWRMARHAVAGTPYVVCRKHHPELDGQASTAAEIHRAWVGRGKSNGGWS